MVPYPPSVVDMGSTCALQERPTSSACGSTYATELAREAEADPAAKPPSLPRRPSFVVGTPAGAAAMRRVLENFKKQKLVWVTDVEAVLKAAGEKL